MQRFNPQPRRARQGDRWAHISCEYRSVPLPNGTVTRLLSKGVTFAPGRNKLKRDSGPLFEKSRLGAPKSVPMLRRVMLTARRESQRGER